ncbi:MAG: BRO family protein [Magnetospirillum sp.]|nr:BRO family protein [Magnetospirillum sp.]
MTALSPFVFEGAAVRVIDRDGEPWFVGADVCRVLGYANTSQALGRLDPDEKGVYSTDTLGGAQEMTVVSEPGLYRLIFGSRKPVAERFKRWISHDVLPAIRKTGRYVARAGEAPDIREVTRLLQEARRVNRAMAVDVANRLLPLVAVAGHVVPVIPGRPTPDQATAATIARLRHPDVPAMERARSYGALREAGYLPAEIGLLVSRTARHVQKSLRLLTLATLVMDAVEAAKIKPEHALQLAPLGEAAQASALARILAGELGWRTGTEIAASVRSMVSP